MMTFGMHEVTVRQHIAEQRRLVSSTEWDCHRSSKVLAMRRRVGMAIIEVGLHVMTPRHGRAVGRPSAVRGYAV